VKPRGKVNLVRTDKPSMLELKNHTYNEAGNWFLTASLFFFLLNLQLFSGSPSQNSGDSMFQ